MVRAVEHYPPETIVAVQGKLRKSVKRVKNAAVHDYEIEVHEVHKIGDLSEHVPFTVYDAENINRDTEDKEEDDDGESVSSLFPSDGDSQLPSTRGTSPRGTPRHSGELARHSVDQSRASHAASRSKILINLRTLSKLIEYR